MKDNYAAAMKAELVFEGGKVDNKDDPGGRTNEGVTQRVYASWCKNNGKPVRDVYDMTPDERDAIYRLQYAEKIRFDDMPAGIDFVLLDGAVNSGVAQVVKWAQRVCRNYGYKGAIDGILGEGTFQALANCPDQEALINGILDRRMAFLQALKNWPEFKGGWSARVLQVRHIALGMTGGIAITPSAVSGANKKAEVADAKPIPSTAPGAGTAGIGGATAAASGVLMSIKVQLDPVIAMLPDSVRHYGDQLGHWITNGEVILGSIGGLAAIGGGLWLAYAEQRAAKLHDVLDTNPAASARPTPAVP